MIWLFLKGILIGVAIAAPVGPIGMLCVQKSLRGGFLIGLSAGIGAAIADAIYGAIAASSLTFIMDFLLKKAVILNVLGSIFLCYIGIKMLLPHLRVKSIKDAQTSYLHTMGNTFFLTITSPITVLAFIAIFSGIGLQPTHDYLDAGILVSGVFIGSIIWWVILAGIISYFRKSIDLDKLIIVDKFAGVVLLVFGLWLLKDFVIILTS